MADIRIREGNLKAEDKEKRVNNQMSEEEARWMTREKDKQEYSSELRFYPAGEPLMEAPADRQNIPPERERRYCT